MSDAAVSILRKMVRSDEYWSLDGAWFSFDGSVGLTDNERALLAALRDDALAAESSPSLR